MELLTKGYRECKVHCWREGARGMQACVSGIEIPNAQQETEQSREPLVGR